MRKRVFWLLLAVLATQSIGCWFHRPYLVRRWWWHDSCCGAVGHDCCAAPAGHDYGPMPPATSNPAMPPATPLTRR